MLLQTIQALKQEKQMGQELSSVLQGKINAIENRINEILVMLNNVAKDAADLANDVKDEMQVREKAIDVLVGDQ